MTEFELIALAHTGKYPLMRAEDYVKLAYQHSMGPGHLVKSHEQALLRLLEETGKENCTADIEPIGNGLARLMLDGSKFEIATAEAAELFEKTANSFPKSMEKLTECLSSLCGLSEKGLLTCDACGFIADYKAQGCPMLSHSEAYRAAYAPSYRVIYIDLVKEYTHG